jgi:tRNA pseudouridine(55) synthase
MSFMVYKRIGETTSELANRVKQEHGFKKVVICGKLDPMARGMARVLADADTKLMRDNLHHNKTYKFYLVLNLKTDTDDIMGLIDHIHDEHDRIDEVMEYIKSLATVKEQKFHPYSAIKVRMNGERLSLHQWAKRGLLTNEMTPSKAVTVYNISIGDLSTMQLNEYISMIQPRLEMIQDSSKEAFRVDEITSKWSELINNPPEPAPSNVYIIPIRMTVSSGYYIRMISNSLYSSLGITSHIYDIHRIYT